MNRSTILSLLLSLGATQAAFGRQPASFEDAVRMASVGLIIRGTVLDTSTEGKDAPVPKRESGAPALLYSSWRIRIDDCYYSAGDDCPARRGATVNVAAVTGVAAEREGRIVYEELLTNSAALAVTVPLRPGGSFLLFLRPDSSHAGGYQIVPLRNGSRTVSTDRIDVELRRYDLLSETTKALPATEDLRRRRSTSPSAPLFDEAVSLSDLAGLIQRIRGSVPDAPQLDPQVPQH